jgi:hypothetical protein
MRHLILSTSVALALVAAQPVQAAPADATGTVAPAAPSPSLDVRYLRLSELPAVLASTAGEPSAWHTSTALKGLPLAAGDDADPLLAWVPASALASPAARAEALDIASSGVAMLVTAKPGDARHESRLFGVEARESTVLYQPLPDGGLHLHILEAGENGGVSSAVAQRVVDEVHRQADDHRGPPAPAHAHRQRRDAAAPSPPQAVPMRRWSATKLGRNGAFIRLSATVTRDVSARHDSKLVTVKSHAEVIPFRNGLNDYDVSRDGRHMYFAEPFAYGVKERDVLVVPNEYGVTTWLGWPEGQAPRMRLLAHHPMTEGTTERSVADKHATKTSWGLSTSPDVTRGLADGKVSTEGKLPLSFSFSQEYVDEQSVQMTLKDYSTAFQAHEAPNHMWATWTFPLGTDVASNPAYFGKDELSSALMTPMMKSAALETIATWRVDGAYEGPLTVSSAGVVVDRVYWRWEDATSVIEDCDDQAYDHTSEICRSTDIDVAPDRHVIETSQPIASVTLDLSSPYLTRTPTVLLMSLGHDNLCLGHASAESSEIALARCDRSVGNRAQQWMLDEAGRYVSRASGLCLQIDGGSDQVRAMPCSQALTQQWEWRADRIHTRSDGGRRRLHTDGATLSAAYRDGVDALLPVNATNALLPPWTTYPLKPRKGDYIPGFHFTAAPVPDSYLAFDDVDGSQRWAAIPLIFGIP